MGSLDVAERLPPVFRGADYVVAHDRAGTSVPTPPPLPSPQGRTRLEQLSRTHPDDRPAFARSRVAAVARPGEVQHVEVRTSTCQGWQRVAIDIGSWLDVPGIDAVLVAVTALDPETAPSQTPPAPPPAATSWALLTLSRYGDVMAAVGTVEALYGRSADELVGMNGLELIHPDDHAALLESWVEVVERGHVGRAIRQRVVHADGTATWVLSTIGPSGEPGKVMVHDVDISALRAAEAATVASQARLRVLAEEVPAAVFLCDEDGVLDFANETFIALTGLRPPACFLDLLDEEGQTRWREHISCATGTADFSDVLVAHDRHLEVRCQVPQHDGLVVGVIEDATAAHRWRDRARHDRLTGLLSREAILEEISRRAARSIPDATVAFVDLDGFKAVNDELGHAAGDGVLQRVADILVDAVRPGDAVGRWGGDEFVLVLDRLPDAGVSGIVDRIKESLTGLGVEGDDGTGPTLRGASVGVVGVGAGADPHDVVCHADAAMYRDKRVRRGAGTSH